MDVKIIEKQSFTVIGKAGQGFSNEGFKWIPPLWEEANSKFNEIHGLAKLDDAGNIIGIWGAMSDINDKFERWAEQGKYLAGCEAIDNAIAPEGWIKWVIPAYKYAVVKCTQDTYKDVFSNMIKEYLPQQGFAIVGAVHEFYDPKESNGGLYLYFPVEKI